MRLPKRLWWICALMMIGEAAVALGEQANASWWRSGIEPFIIILFWSEAQKKKAFLLFNEISLMYVWELR